MRINYHNEDYKSVIFNIVVYLIIIIFVIIWGICNSGKSVDVGLIIFLSIWIIFLGTLLFFAIKSYIRRKEKRNLNLFIMKNGKHIKGKIISIYDNYISRVELDMKRSHNVTAEINYNIDGEDKIIAVDKLCININNLKKYENKIVSIYIYNNMSYVDIVN